MAYKKQQKHFKAENFNEIRIAYLRVHKYESNMQLYKLRFAIIDFVTKKYLSKYLISFN